MKYKTKSWKEIIDPSFDTLIKAVDKSFDLMEMQSNEEIENFLMNLKSNGIRGFKPFYESDISGKMFNMLTMFGDQPFGNEINSVDQGKVFVPAEVISHMVIDTAKDLDEKSREYYYKKFEQFSSQEKLDDFKGKMSEEEKQEWEKSCSADLSSLNFHKLIKAVCKQYTVEEKRRLRGMVGIDEMMALSFSLMDQFSLLINKKSLKTLYKEAKNGSLDSLCKVLRFDKTLFDHEWVRELMMKAMITGDNDFFENVGHAIKTEPPIGKLKWARLKHVLITFWNMGLYKLSVPQLDNLLMDSGIKRQDDLDAFEKFIKDEIKPLFSA
jgi:hypothetical protein